MRNLLAANEVHVRDLVGTAGENHAAFAAEILVDELGQLVIERTLGVVGALISFLQKLHRAVGVDAHHRNEDVLILFEGAACHAVELFVAELFVEQGFRLRFELCFVHKNTLFSRLVDYLSEHYTRVEKFCYTRRKNFLTLEAFEDGADFANVIFG